MGKKDKNKKQKANVDSAAIDTDDGRKVITDSRFAKVHTDPRFQKAPNRKAKVVIDSRFNRMFTDERFSSSSALLDKRGKHKKRPENALRRYYRLEEDAGEADKREIEKEEEDEEEIKEGLRRDIDEDDESKEKFEKSKGDLLDLEFSDELELSEEEEDDVETDDATSTSDTADEVDDVDLGEDAFVEAEQVPEIEKETHRLAVVNMDWNQVKAVDLFMLLSSCLPKGGQIIHVAVYPSEFGLQRMSEEAVHGPVGLFGDDRKNDSDDDEDEIDNEKLRAYEKSRLKYYFAVVECDSVTTADYLYKNCDGVELERSANKLDLRFIPDSMEFEHPPRDVAKDLPANYEPLDFQTRALQHSNILLSWDDDEPHRAKTLKRKLTADQLDKLELEEFLASTESDDNDEEEGNDKEDPSEKKNKKRDMYRALIQGGDGSDNNEEEGQDMEVTFNTGLEDISKKILEKKDKKSETVWEAYLKKRKEKRKKRKNKSMNSSDDESEYSDQEPLDEADDFFEEDTPVERKKVVGGGGKKDKEKDKDIKRGTEAEASVAELELLFADDKGADNNVKGYKINPKTAKGKKKKGKEVPTEDKLPTVDIEDPRFSGLFSNPLFALDPTDPQFKRSATYARQFSQQQQKGREELAEEESENRDNKAPLEPNVYQKNKEGGSRPDASSSKDKHELSSLVKSIKMKSKQIVSSVGNKKQEKMELDGEKRKKSDTLGSSAKKKARV